MVTIDIIKEEIMDFTIENDVIEVEFKDYILEVDKVDMEGQEINKDTLSKIIFDKYR